MAKYFAKDGKFEFPTGVMPQTNLPSTPEAPQIAASRLESLAASIDAAPGSDQVEWAAESLFHAEMYGSISTPVVNKCIKLLETHAKTHALASYVVGNWYLFGLFGHITNKYKAKELYKDSIKLKGTRAWYRMGSSAEEKGDIDRAVSRYECGARLEDAACVYRLAIAILKGQFGYQNDATKAVKLLAKACNKADRDFPQPFFLLGLILLGEVEQGVVPLDRVKGLELIEKAASLHFAPALVRLTAAHQQGLIQYDPDSVFRYLHCVSQQERYLVFQNIAPQFGGDPEVQLSKLFLCGAKPLSGPNEEWAYKFAVVGTECNNSTAQFAIGYFAEVGIYIQRDLNLATTMYEQSSSNNCDAATERLARFKKSNSGGVDLQRSTTITRRDHDQALQRTISQNGKNISMASIVKSLGQQLIQGNEEHWSGSKQMKVNLVEPDSSHIRSTNTSTELVDTTNALEALSTESSIKTVPTSIEPNPSQPTNHTSPVTMPIPKPAPYPDNVSLKSAPYPEDSTGKAPYPEEASSSKAPYPSDRPTGEQIQVPKKPEPAKTIIAKPALQGPDCKEVPYPSSPDIKKRSSKPVPNPANNVLKSPYPLMPPETLSPQRSPITERNYPDSPDAKRSSMFIPDSPSELSSGPGSPVRMSGTRPRSPVRSFTPSFGSPSWVKSHARSCSTSPERPPSPSKSSSPGLFSKIRNRLSGVDQIEGLGVIEFDDPNAPPSPSRSPEPLQAQNSAVQTGKPYFPPYPDARDQPTQPYRIPSRPQKFDAPLGAIQENDLFSPPNRVIHSSSPPSRSGTPVHRKPINSNSQVRIESSSSTPLPLEPRVSESTTLSEGTKNRSQSPVNPQRISPASTNSSQAPSIKRQPVSGTRNGHKHSMSMASPASAPRVAPPKTNRVVSSPLKPQGVEVKPAAQKHNALSFEDMGIKLVVEEKNGPCVIA